MFTKQEADHLQLLLDDYEKLLAENARLRRDNARLRAARRAAKTRPVR